MSSDKIIQDIIADAEKEREQLVTAWEEEKKQVTRDNEIELDKIRANSVRHLADEKERYKRRKDALLPVEMKKMEILGFDGFYNKHRDLFEKSAMANYNPADSIEKAMPYFTPGEKFTAFFPKSLNPATAEKIKTLFARNNMTVSYSGEGKGDTIVISADDGSFMYEDSPAIYLDEVRAGIYNKVVGNLYKKLDEFKAASGGAGIGAPDKKS